MSTTVYDTLLLPDGTPAKGVVTFTLAIAAPDDEALYTAAPAVAALCADGSFSIELQASDDPDWKTDGSVPYIISVSTDGLSGTISAMIPDGGPWRLADLMPLADVPDVTLVPTGAPGPQGPEGPRGPEGPQGPQGLQGAGIRILSAVASVGDLPTTGNSPGDAHLVTATGNVHIWGDDSAWHEIGHVQGPQGPQGIQGPPGADATALALDALTDVDVAAATTGAMLQKQPGGMWQGVQFNRPLNWLTDVSTGTIDADGNPVAADQTPAGHVLGTSAAGFWEPLSLAYLEEQIVGPLQAEIGDPHVVAVHTNLVGYISEVADRVAALEATTEEIAAEVHLVVDRYSGSFTTVRAGDLTGPVDVDLALATAPGPNGEVYPDLGAIAGGAAVWVDFGGSLGRVNTADGVGVYGSTLKEWIRRASVLTVHRDDTDPAHPVLMVDRVAQPTAAGSSLNALTKTEFKAVVAGATDWATFQAAVAAL